MENKALTLILISAILITLFLVTIISAKDNSNDELGIIKQCAKDCMESRDVAHHDCISVHKNESTQIRNNYKICTKNIKDSYKNNTANKTELNSGIKNCTKTYLDGLKQADNKRKECFKNADINCEKKCIEISCNETQKPVCGKNNVTYQNECQLKKANIKKACDGQCPCLAECVKEGKTGVLGKDKCCDGLNETIINSMGPVSRIKCINGSSIICGNGICEIGEDISCPPCVEFGCMAPCQAGACPKDCKKPGNSNIAVKCTVRNEACSDVYEPVCGWFNSSIQCFRYPCANNYANSCEACKNPSVDYWTPGKCPKR